jgi:DNA-binding beta-propeller fold protein YncE
MRRFLPSGWAWANGSSRSVVAAWLVCVGLLTVPAASAADSVYWSNASGNKISFANLNGSGGGDVFTGSATVKNPQGVAFDPAAGRIYWANAGGTTISFANLNGSGGGDLATGSATVNAPVGVAIDPAAGRIYWANSGGTTISFAILDGTGGGDLATGSATVNGPEGVAVDSAAGRIYWANAAGTKISFANLKGSGGGDLATGSATVKNPQGVAFDPAAGRIYWANAAGTKISFANLNGSGGGDLATGSATVKVPAGVAVDPAAERIYWANQNANKISFANINGGGGADLATGSASVSAPTGVAIDPAAGRVYWASFLANKISFANVNGSGGGDLATGLVTPSGSVFPVLLQVPGGAGVPVVSGATGVGASLLCSQGTWAPDLLSSFDYRAAQSFAYGWAENGTPIAGATSSSITAGSPGSYTCQVTASNLAGPTAQTSTAFTVTAAPPPPLPPPPPPAAAALASLSGLSVSPNSLRAASSGASITAKKPKTGATVSYTDSQASTTTFTVLKPIKGFTRKGRCVAKGAAGKKNAKRCTLYMLAGSFNHTDKAGRNTFHFTGRVRGQKLKPGAYRLQAIPRFAGRNGTTRTTGFKVVR